MKKSLRLLTLLTACALLSNCALCIPVRTSQDEDEDSADMSAREDLGETGSGGDMSPALDMNEVADMSAPLDMSPRDMTSAPDASPRVTSDFVTTWDTRISAKTGDASIEIPFLPGAHDFMIDWEDDGVFDEDGVDAPTVHEYASPGVYTVRIRGAFPGLAFGSMDDRGDAKKLLSVDAWGDNKWTTMEGMFAGCTSFQILATDAPDLSNVTSMKDAFLIASKLNSNINHWDVSNVTNMHNTFYGTNVFNQPLNNWDVSNVTTMRSMFYGCNTFDQPLDNWDVGNVTTMQSMFYATDRFDQSLGGWTFAEDTSLSSMLSNSNLSKANYDATLIGWYANPNTPDGLGLGASGLTYCAGATARDKLITEKGWEITDGGEDCP